MTNEEYESLAEVFLKKAEKFSGAGSMQSAAYYYDKIVLLYEDFPEEKKTLTRLTYYKIALGYQKIQQYEKSAQYLSQFIELQKALAIDADILLGNGYGMLSLLQYHLERLDEADRYMEISRDLRETFIAAHSDKAATVYKSLAVDHSILGKSEESFHYFQKALAAENVQACLSVEDKIEIYKHLAIFYEEKKDLEAANQYHQQAETLTETELKKKYGELANLYYSLAQCCLDIGDTEKATTYYAKAEEFLNQLPANDQQLPPLLVLRNPLFDRIHNLI